MRSSIETLLENNDLVGLKDCNFYDLLGINRNSVKELSTRFIAKQYRQLALRFHPDQHQGDATKAEVFKLINEAYSTLSDRFKRAGYDAELSEITSTSGARGSFFHTEPETPLPTETYCFFQTALGDWKAFGFEADITVENKERALFKLSGHILPIKLLIFSPNQRYLASADMNNVIKVWDMSLQECMHTFAAQTDSISHLFFTENSAWLISGHEGTFFSSTRKIEVWDFKNGVNLGIYSGFFNLGSTRQGNDYCAGSGVTHLAISPKGKVVPGTEGEQATTKHKQEIIVSIWPENVAKPLHLYGYELSATKTHVLIRDKLSVTLWDLVNESLLATFNVTPTKAQIEQDCRIACAFNPVNQTFAFAIGDIRIMDYQGQLISQFKNNDVVDKLIYSPDGKYLISQSRYEVAVHCCATGKSYCLTETRTQCNGVRISPDSQKIMVIPDVYKVCKVEVYNIATGEQLINKKLKYEGVRSPGLLILRAEVDIFTHDFSADSQSIALGMSDKSVRLIDLATKKMEFLKAHEGGVIRLAFSPSHLFLVTASRDDNMICVWDYQIRTLLQQVSVGYTQHLIFVDDNRFLFNMNKQIKLWDISTGEINSVCRISVNEKLYCVGKTLFFEDDQGRLSTIDISARLDKLRKPLLEIDMSMSA